MDKVKMRCMGCKKLTLVNKVSWKCDKCLNKEPQEKEFFEELTRASKAISQK